MDSFVALKTLLSTPRHIVITSHTNPDGDAIGSSMALCHHLTKMGHTVSVMVPNEMPDFLTWIPGANKVLYYEEARGICNKLIQQAEYIFCLDYNALSRVDDMGAAIKESKSKKVLIDHHLFPDDFADFAWSDTSASSTCELIFDLIKLWGELDTASKDTLECIYTGILTDTGGFSFATSPKLFRAVADLTERGIDNAVLQDRVFNSYTEKRLRLLGFCISERLEIIEEYSVAIMAISQEDHVKHNIRRGDMEGVVNYMLKIKDVKIAIIVSERKQEIKLSFRSKGDFSVQEIAKAHFNGGGHRNAAGGSSNASLQETILKIKEILPQSCPRN